VPTRGRDTTRYESEKAPRTRKRVHRVLLARDDDVPVQQVRRPVGLAPRPRDEADGVVLAPAAPLLAEAALGDAGHFFRGVRAGSPRSSRRWWWFASRRANWVLARRALRSLQLCLLLFCRSQSSRRVPLAKIERARVLGAAVYCPLPCGHDDGPCTAQQSLGHVCLLGMPSVLQPLARGSPGMKEAARARRR
jgi:hypothetical protein